MAGSPPPISPAAAGQDLGGASPGPGPDELAPREGGRIPFARRLDDPQRVDGGSRWSVDATRRRCTRCGSDLVDREPFHSVLEEAPAPLVDSEEPELFVRRDYCEPCFAASPPPRAFAHWRSVLPAPLGGVRKIVNLASLLSHFHSLVETSRELEEEDRERWGAEPGGTDRALGGDLDAILPGQVSRSWPSDPEGERPEAGSAPTAAISAASSGASSSASVPEPRQRLAYLLALFLVRRRMLRWEGVEGETLRLRCRESDRPVELPVPRLPPAELEAAIAEFEDLFR